MKNLLMPLLIITLAVSLTACTQEISDNTIEQSQLETSEIQNEGQQQLSTPNVQGAQNMQQATELKVEDVTVGTGTEAVAGKQVTVHYTGTLTNGQKFDSSKDRSKPFTFTLGAGQVIQGWDQGVAGMKIGGVRKLTIPPQLGYGSRAMGPIPANSTLLFDVELLKVE